MTEDSLSNRPGPALRVVASVDGTHSQAGTATRRVRPLPEVAAEQAP